MGHKMALLWDYLAKKGSKWTFENTVLESVSP